MAILKAQMLFRLTAAEAGANDFGGPSFVPKMEHLLNLSVGTSAYQYDLQFFDERSVNASSNDDLDLAGVLANALGATLTMAEIVLMAIINAPRSPLETANVSNLTIGNGSNPWETWGAPTGCRIGPIPPGGFAIVGSPAAAGLGAVTASTGDILRIANGAGGVAKYQIAILGRSA